MTGQAANPTAGGTGASGVRRHHTISSASSSRRKEPITEEVLAQEPQGGWPEDEVLDPEWVGSVGAVGEKGGLHRQSSLPTRYHRGFQGQPSKSGNVTPKTKNSLSAIAGHDGEEDEDYAREIDGVRNEEHHAQVLESLSAVASPLSPHFGPPHVPSPPPAASGVRRHQSLTCGAGRQLGGSGLKRSGTLQAQGGKHSGHHSPSPPGSTDDYGEPESYFPPPSPSTQSVTSPIGRQSPWNGSTEGSWRRDGQGSGFSTSSNNSGSSVIIDDVTRALSALDVQSNPSYQQQQGYPGQSGHPPRFGSNQGQSPLPSPGSRSQTNNNGGKLALVTDFGGRQQQAPPMPASASAYVPPIGHALHGLENSHRGVPERSQTMSGAGWEQPRDRLVGRVSNPNLHYGYQQQGQSPPVPPMPQQYLQQPQMNQQGQSPRLGAAQPPQQQQQAQAQGQGQFAAAASTPIDVPSLIAAKGYNPANFEIRPPFARFFVIKSYTEDDVHKSLKYEIWSSTDPGNKRLDKAFKECAGRGPIYLFFSVNASGHFCGMAEMLTPVDYTRSSTVWASDKWKGVFKVRWIFVRDIPNVNLRHIKLNNTQERKPVTNSRDTQELLPDAGQEMLRIFHTHPARTSLLQDFAFYELQAMQKLQVQGPPSPTQSAASLATTPSLVSQQPLSPQPTAQGSFGMGGTASPYGGAGMQMTPQMQQMYQMMQQQQQQQYGAQSQQAMHQSVMRHPTNPGNGGQGGYMGMPGQGF